MSTCAYCGAHAVNRVTRGPLTVHLDPAGVFWKGIRLPGITLMETKMLHSLCIDGKASRVALEFVGTGGYVGRNVVSSQISKLRRLLPKAVRIEPLYRWGYKIVVEENEMTVKDEVVKEASELADDVKAVISIVVGGDGKPYIKWTTGAALPGVLKLLGVFVIELAGKIVVQQTAKASE